MINGKKGQDKYYLVLSLILGLLVLAIGLYFIFQEYFTQNEVNWETCRQSVILRSANLNDAQIFEDTIKNQFPFKCKTQVVNIDYYDEKRAMKTIADTMSGCWYMMGEGKYKLYGANWVFSDLNCFVCARIHFDDKVKDKYGDLKLAEYLASTNFDKSQTYLQYLSGVSSLSLQNLDQVKINPSNNNNFLVVYQYPKKAWTGETLGSLTGAGILTVGSVIVTGGASIPVILFGTVVGGGSGLFIGNAISDPFNLKQGIEIVVSDEKSLSKCTNIETIPA